MLRGGFRKLVNSGWRLLHPACFLLIIWVSQTAAQVSGPCSDCHTMHNSQDGASVTGPSGVWPALTKTGCGPCHSGLNDGTNTTPFVWGSGAVYGQTGTETGTNTLAGGTFQFVTQDDPGNAYGHNVIRPQQPDSRLVEPPGFVDGFDVHGQVGSNWQTNRLSCQGLYGCHGQHVDDKGVAGAHHADDSVIDGATVGTSFRFLLGVKGKEDPKWEYQPTFDRHNQYYAAASDSDTISYLCARCHGTFHSTGGVSPWLRHPADFDMNLVSGEYENYGGAGVNEYSVLAPVGSTDVSAVKVRVLQADGDAFVTCLSCHRAHGSEYRSSLRWDNNDCNAGVDNQDCGCFVCHTSKDGI